MLKMLIIVPSSLSPSLPLPPSFSLPFLSFIKLFVSSISFSLSPLCLSVPISLKRRKFIHYPGRTVLDSSRLDNWTANPIEDSLGAPAANKIVFHPLAGENFVSLSCLLVPSRSLPLFRGASSYIKARMRLSSSSNVAAVAATAAAFPSSARLPRFHARAISSNPPPPPPPPPLLTPVNRHITQLPPFAALPTTTHSTPSCVQLINFCTEL